MIANTRKFNLSEHTLTIADLCEAISQREIKPVVRNGHYEISRSDLRKLRRTHTAAQPDSFLSDLSIYALGPTDSEMGCPA